MIRLFTLKYLLLFFFFCINCFNGRAQIAGDFQTKNLTGNWSDFNAWNVYNSSLWVAATSGQLPTATTSVFVQAGYIISVDNGSAVCKNLYVNGSNMSKIAFSTATSILNVKGNMILSSISHNCFGTWQPGAKIVFSGTGAQGFTNLSANSVFVYIEVNKSSGTLTASSNLTISDTLSLITGTLKIGAGDTLTLNGAALIKTAGYLGGASSSDLIITGTTGGTILLPLSGNINLRNVTVSGTRTLQMDGIKNINLYGIFNIESGATYDNGGESEVIKKGGGSPSIIISGKFINRDKDNFTGANGAIRSIPATLNAGCTIEYALTGDQNVTWRSDYKNITFSGTGTKTLASGFNPTGTVTISGSAIVDAKNFTFGNAGTNLVMKGSSKLITAGTGTKPNMQGTYLLNPGTTIEFNNMNATLEVIRLTEPIYYNIMVSGTGIGTNSLGKSIKMQSGGTFTVQSGAIFKFKNSNGFSGGVNTAVGNNNNPAITLEDGSTIEYNGTSQVITNQAPYSNLTFSAPGNKIAPSGILTINGNLLNTGGSSFIHNSGTVLLNGTAQIFAGLTYNNLILSNGGIKTTAGNSTIIDSIKVSTSTTLNIAANDSIFLHSDASQTARVGQVDGIINYNSNAKFVVERYISAKRAWRFLSVPVSNAALTFHQAWQENMPQGSSIQTTPSGFGTQITDNVTPDIINGFDYNSPNGPSVKIYDINTDAWIGITSTNNAIETTEGLMTFVRGDRTVQGLNAPATITVLRTKGALYTGTRPGIIVTAGKFASIGNPFASAIDMRTIGRTADIDSFIYVWDPNLTGVGYGAFQTFTFIDGNYYPTPGGGSYGAANVPYNMIASGQAFFVYGSTSGSGGVFTIKETDKAYNDLPLVFRPAQMPETEIRNNLYILNADSSTALLDGVLTIVGGNYNNLIDGKDAIKVSNFSENLAIEREDKLLAVEKRHTPNGSDTIFYNIANMKVAPYRFEIVADNFNGKQTAAFLEDTYLKTKTLVNLNGNTSVNFNITNESGSWNPERFRIVFVLAGGALPITFSTVKAYGQNKNISVEWKVDNEKNMKQYEVEKSADGQHFTLGTIASAKLNNSGSVNYQWLDVNAFAGNNYYRIKSIDINKAIQYSNIVKVVMGKGISQIMVYPNPVSDGNINLQFINQPKGMYVIRLINKSGQVIMIKQIEHAEGSSAETLQMDKTLAHGTYLLETTKPDKSQVNIKVLN